MWNWLAAIMKKKSDLNYKSAMKLIYDKNIRTLRSKVKILIVDDEPFEIIDMLNERKYDIYYKKDITYAIEAEPFDIVIVDIRGIASALGSSMGGFTVAKEVKEHYPVKQVWCYSGSTIKSEVASRIKEIDGYISKDTDIDQWCEKLDNIIHKYCSEEYQVDILEKQLKACSVSEEDIKRVIKEYKSNLENKNFGSVIEMITTLVGDGKSVVDFVKLIYSYIEHYTA